MSAMRGMPGVIKSKAELEVQKKEGTLEVNPFDYAMAETMKTAFFGPGGKCHPKC